MEEQIIQTKLWREHKYQKTGKEITTKKYLKKILCQRSSQAFGRECLFREPLAEHFVTYFLVVISLQKVLGKQFSLQLFVGRSFSSKFGWTGITLLRFSARISLQWIFGSDFSSNIFGTYFLFRVFVWIMCFFQVLFERDFFWEFICR